MTEIRNPPAGPLVGDVEADLISMGVWFGKAAYRFAQPDLCTEVRARASEIVRLYPRFGVFDHDGIPLLTAKQARTFVQDYDDEAFRQALRMYAVALDKCQTDLTSKILNGQIAICHEREAGETWTWIPARKCLRLRPNEENPTMARTDGATFTGVLAFNVAEVIAWLTGQSSKTVLTIEGKLAPNLPALSTPPAHLLPKAKTGPKGDLTGRTAARILADLKAGLKTIDELSAMKRENLASDYGVKSRDTARKALTLAVSQFNPDK